MYYNDAASCWTCNVTTNPLVLPFHERMPHYAKTALHRLPRSLCSEFQVAEIYVKDETNRFGLPAFKILGASWATYRAIATQLGLSLACSLAEVTRAVKQTTICLYTATDGNHGRAIARVASILEVQAKIYVPKVMLDATKELIRGEGACVIVVDGDYDETVKQADEQSRALEGLLIQDTAWPGYENVPEWIVEGYSTMMTEIDQQMFDSIGRAPDLVIAPVGVGSLAHAVVAHYKGPNRRATILTVEPNSAACLKTSLEQRQPTTIATEATIMCGMNCGTVSYTAWPYLRDGIDACVTVSDREAQLAQNTLQEEQLNVGFCAAATFAAMHKVCKAKRTTLGISDKTVIVLLATEGPG